MGAEGLWSLLNSKIVNPESLCGYRIAVSMSIWSFQFQSEEKILENIQKKIGKLLYFGIKPVIIFDDIIIPLTSKRLKIKGSTEKRDDVKIMAKKILEKRIMNAILKREELLGQKQKIYLEQLQSRTIVAFSDSDFFSRNQIESLVKRRRVTEKLEKLKNLGDNKIASNEKKRFILIKKNTDNNAESNKEKEELIIDDVEYQEKDDYLYLENNNDMNTGIERSEMEGTLLAKMRKEIVYLLEIMGIPWMNAQYKAEAQCVWLLENGLVDGIITDDNDVFLFGAKDHVYRNFFKKNENVLKYSIGSYESEELITFAGLLSSSHGFVQKGIGIKKAIKLRELFKKCNEPFDLATIRTLFLRKCEDKETSRIIQSLKLLGESEYDEYAMIDYKTPMVKSVSEFKWNDIKTDRLCVFFAEKLGWKNQKTMEFINSIKRI